MSDKIMWVRYVLNHLLILLLTCSVAVPATAYTGSDLSITNNSFNATGMRGEYQVTPTPVEVFRAELNQSTLPGPRYMAFGPSVISVSIDLQLLAVCFAIVLIGLVIWFVSFRKQNNERKGED